MLDCHYAKQSSCHRLVKVHQSAILDEYGYFQILVFGDQALPIGPLVL